MSQFEKVIFTNMCMVYDETGYVLVQDRVDSSWPGIAFPGGHVENGESFTDAVIREVLEETGLHISCPQLCGIKQWETEGGFRYVVLCYKTQHYEGNLVSSDEGKMSCVKLVDMSKMQLASGMTYMIKLFLDDNISEHTFRKENNEWVDVLK